jgi:DNA-binding transcriptional regulator YhcF (GntR family)
MRSPDAPTLPKYLRVAAAIRRQIADGTLRPGQPAPSGAELGRAFGYSTLTCRKALRALTADGLLVPGPSRNARPRVADPHAPDLERDLADAARALSAGLAARRHAAGLTQAELAERAGVSVTTVGHAETGRTWQSRRFWERADAALGATGDLLRLHDAYRAASSPPRPAPTQRERAQARPIQTTVAQVRAAGPGSAAAQQAYALDTQDCTSPFCTSETCLYPACAYPTGGASAGTSQTAGIQAIIAAHGVVQRGHHQDRRNGTVGAHAGSAPVGPPPFSPPSVAPRPAGGSEVGLSLVGPSPVAPSPVAPSPVAPSPVAPSPVAPSPVAPSPVAPPPVGPPGSAAVPVGPSRIVIVWTDGSITTVHAPQIRSAPATPAPPDPEG